MPPSRQRGAINIKVIGRLFRGPLIWNNCIVLLEDNTTAYIVRVWLEHREVEDAPATWRGSIEHVASGKIKYLTDLDERLHGSSDPSWKRWESVLLSGRSDVMY